MRWQVETGETVMYPYHITSIRKATPDGYKVDLRVPATGDLTDRTIAQGDARHPAQFDKDDPHFHTLAGPNTRAGVARMGPRDTIESKDWILEVYSSPSCDTTCQEENMEENSLQTA